MNALRTAVARFPALDDVDGAVIEIFALVRDALRDATGVFLTGDRDVARLVIEREKAINELHQSTELAAQAQLFADGLPVETRKHLLLVLSVLPELERSGDLAEHIASHAAQGLSGWLTPRGRRLVREMGDLGTEMWTLAADAYALQDGSVADELRRRDDEVDDLHVSLTAELAASQVSVPVAIQMALVARYFERLGDHAVNVTRRLQATVLDVRGS